MCRREGRPWAIFRRLIKAFSTNDHLEVPPEEPVRTARRDSHRRRHVDVAHVVRVPELNPVRGNEVALELCILTHVGLEALLPAFDNRLSPAHAGLDGPRISALT
jgi:hypothetical protein